VVTQNQLQILLIAWAVNFLSSSTTIHLPSTHLGSVGWSQELLTGMRILPTDYIALCIHLLPYPLRSMPNVVVLTQKHSLPQLSQWQTRSRFVISLTFQGVPGQTVTVSASHLNALLLLRLYWGRRGAQFFAPLPNPLSKRFLHLTLVCVCHYWDIFRQRYRISAQSHFALKQKEALRFWLIR